MERKLRDFPLSVLQPFSTKWINHITGLTWALGEAAADCNRSYLCLWDRVREKKEEEKKKTERGGAKRGTTSAEEERERRREKTERGWESVRGQRGRNTSGQERGESSDSCVLTQRCLTLKGMCWLWEVVLLSQMTSASLLKTIGYQRWFPNKPSLLFPSEHTPCFMHVYVFFFCAFFKDGLCHPFCLHSPLSLLLLFLCTFTSHYSLPYVDCLFFTIVGGNIFILQFEIASVFFFVFFQRIFPTISSSSKKLKNNG